MNEEQHLRDVADLCRREAGNSMTHEAKKALSAMAVDFDQRANAVKLRDQEQRLAFVSASERKHLF